MDPGFCLLSPLLLVYVTGHVVIVGIYLPPSTFLHYPFCIPLAFNKYLQLVGVLYLVERNHGSQIWAISSPAWIGLL